jgi:anti-sigma regulatory factor (Ser/Thr protein kinase)
VSPSYHATFTSDPRSVGLARNATASFARLCGFPEGEVADIRLAVGEAVTNAAQYGRAKRGGGFSVNCTFDEGELRIEVQDSGHGFDGSEPSGFGTIIMRTLMNSITYSRGGTRVRLVKRMNVS